MVGLGGARRRLILVVASVITILLLFNFSLVTGNDGRSEIPNRPIPVHSTNKKPAQIPSKIPAEPAQTPSQTPIQTPSQAATEPTQSPPQAPAEPVPTPSQVPDLPIPSQSDSDASGDSADVGDHHPIAGYMKKADAALKSYEDGISRTFKETIDKYRREYGRHPPPGFRAWYKFARSKAVHNIDDFEQIMDDMRPFWGINASLIREQAAGLSIAESNGVSAVYIRNKKVWKSNWADWRTETFEKMIQPFVEHLPDMDITINREDQPRITVPWDDLQALLKKEAESRRIAVGSSTSWTSNMTGFYKEGDTYNVDQLNMTLHAEEQYMLIAKEACPPESLARNSEAPASTETTYKDSNGGFITNFNTSTNLCVIGDSIKDVHGFMFSSSKLQNSPLLLPIFGDRKTNVNSDILFPANRYYKRDERKAYDSEADHAWNEKHDKLFWRGIATGGNNTLNNTLENWKQMHQDRIIDMANVTSMANKTVQIMKQDPNRPGHYDNLKGYNATTFLEQHTDLAYIVSNTRDSQNTTWNFKKQVPISDQFKYKFLVNIDGASSSSGRWRSLLQSKSLPLKATIFKEWYDSRLIAWRHFVPLDNSFDELYGILTYFIGLGKATEASYSKEPFVQKHDEEGQRIANQGREWASKVLREDDMEIYLFRLLIEYGRVIDDHRDLIGYSGDGSELDKYDAKLDNTGTGTPSKDSNGAHG